MQATGRLGEAEEAFRTSNKFNKMFRLAATGLGETLILNGKHDEALAVLQKLEKTNPDHVERCAQIAVAYVEKGDIAKAKEYADKIAKNAPEHGKVNELKAHILLREGKVNDAFQMLDQLSDVGPQLAARLNELGIKLSQAGKGKSAIALYNKAHKIVTPELRYKISLNAALACHRSGDFALGLKYLQRCAKEFGGLNPKIAKIKQALEQGLLQAKKAQPQKSAS
jgi:tetratricopeptide (TPR) repeat protein